MSAYLLARDSKPQNLFFGLLAFDHFSNFFRILFAFVTGAILIFSIPEEKDAESDAPRNLGEFLALLLTLTLGMNLMAESRNLLMIYLSLELVSVISFVM